MEKKGRKEGEREREREMCMKSLEANFSSLLIKPQR